MSEEKTIYAKLEEALLNLALTEKQKSKLIKKLKLLRENKLNIMLVGATGCGKSSTINALFNCAELKEEDAGDKEDPKSNQHTTEAESADSGENAGAEKSVGTDNVFVEVAKVGTKSDPETKDVEKYTIGNLTLWDTPGLGDGTEIDEHHKAVISDLLKEADEDGNRLIDLVLVILDGSTRDLGTSYKILNEVIIPEFGKKRKRILVALN